MSSLYGICLIAHNQEKPKIKDVWRQVTLTLISSVRSPAIRTGVLPRLLSVRDRTKLVAGAPAGVLVAHKSGYNTNVKHDAGILYLRSGPVVAVAMSWSASGVGDAVGDRFVADVARVAAARLRNGGRCR